MDQGDKHPNGVRRLEHLLLELERLADRTQQDHISDIAHVREAILDLKEGRTADATIALRNVSSWAGEISVECGQF